LLARSGKSLRKLPIDLSQETFTAYVPTAAPPHGYALIVFVPPWNAAKIPAGWEVVLDRYGVIFVSAARSGNDASALGRREPLALLAEENIVRRYPVDKERVYIAGFSGGSRIAMRLALAYPDVFRGAILNAGSDPIGTAANPLPPRDLFLQFQNSSHLIYITGDRDIFVLSADSASKRSMREWCQFNVDERSEPSVGHEPIDGPTLARALDTLFAPMEQDAARLAACRSGIENALSAQLQQVRSLIAGGERSAAGERLHEIDTHFGGLAAPQSLELETALARP